MAARGWTAPIAGYALLTGCAVGPDYHRPAVPVPAAYDYAGMPAASVAEGAWWTQLGDPVLDALIDRALAQNKDLAIASARVREYYGRLIATRAPLYPQLDAQLQASRQRDVVSPGTEPVETAGRLGAGMAAWEIDLFGGQRRLAEAGRADLHRQAYMEQAARIAVVAAVASAYVTLRDLDQRLSVSRATARTRKEALDLFRERYKGGVVSQVVVSQAEAQYSTALRAIADLGRQVREQEITISLLLGENPGAIPRGKTIVELTAPAIPAALPSSLIARRPDILAAEQQLVAAGAEIGAARAQYFPAISLTGVLGSASSALTGLWAGPSRTWSYGGVVAAPIFTGGAIRGSVKAAEGRRQQALFDYQQTIQRAFGDVDGALTTVRFTKDELAATTRQVQALTRETALSRDLFEGGYTSYLDVLDADRELFNAELAKSQQQAALLIGAIDLYKALGYGWSAGAGGTSPERDPPAAQP